MSTQRFNRKLAKGGGAFVEGLLQPLGLAHHVAIKMEGPLRRLANRGFPGFSWVNLWYDETFGKEGERNEPKEQ